MLSIKSQIFMPQSVALGVVALIAADLNPAVADVPSIDTLLGKYRAQCSHKGHHNWDGHLREVDRTEEVSFDVLPVEPGIEPFENSRIIVVFPGLMTFDVLRTENPMSRSSYDDQGTSFYSGGDNYLRSVNFALSPEGIAEEMILHNRYKDIRTRVKMEGSGREVYYRRTAHDEIRCTNLNKTHSVQAAAEEVTLDDRWALDPPPSFTFQDRAAYVYEITLVKNLGETPCVQGRNFSTSEIGLDRKLWVRIHWKSGCAGVFRARYLQFVPESS